MKVLTVLMMFILMMVVIESLITSFEVRSPSIFFANPTDLILLGNQIPYPEWTNREFGRIYRVGNAAREFFPDDGTDGIGY